MPLAKPAAALACALALCLPHAFAQQQGQKQPDPAPAEQARPPAVDTAPFVRLAERGRMMVESGRLGWDTALHMSATVEVNEDGSFKPESAKIEWREAGNEDAVELARQLVTAVGESRLLGVLRGHSKSARIEARLDRASVMLGLETEFASEAEAERTATGYDMLLAVERLRKAGTAEGALYKALKITSGGKVFRVSFEMPKEAVAKTVAEMLDERAAPPNRD
jgi:hypothetical protein